MNEKIKRWTNNKQIKINNTQLRKLSQIELFNLNAITDFSSYEICTCTMKVKFTWYFLDYWIISLVGNYLD